jgi:hypothetical protein
VRVPPTDNFDACAITLCGMLRGANADAKMDGGADADAGNGDTDVKGMQHVLAVFAAARRASADVNAPPDQRTMTIGAHVRLSRRVRARMRSRPPRRLRSFAP